MTSSHEIHAAAGAAEPAATLELLGGGAACAVLTPAIRAALRPLAPGQVLRVRTDDPVAQLDVAAWCALTGNALLAATEEAGGVWQFNIRKESKR
jgi:TusA-related sulfurtransferase